MSKDLLNNKKGSLFPNQDLEPEDDDSWQISYLDIITILLGFLIILLSFSTLKDLETFSVSDLFKSENQSEFITTPVDEIKKELEALLAPEIAAGQLRIYRELNDVKIEFQSDDLYSSGSATLQSNSKVILNRVLAAFKLIKYNDFEIDIEGHTDNVPINSSAYPSNWELSTARASNVVKHFSTMGISEDRLKASGYADSRPLVEFDAQGNPYPAEKSKNRRVVLRLYYTSPKQFIANSTIIDSVSTLDEKDAALASNTIDSSNNKTTEITKVEPTPEIAVAKSEQPIQPKEEPPKVVETKEPEPQVAKPTTPKTTPVAVNPIIETTSNTVDSDGCKFSIQINNFESFANALRAATNAEKSTGLKYNIVYNNYLFSVRSTPVSSLRNTILNFNKLPSSIRSTEAAGIINQCYSQPHQYPDVLTYIIQLAFFQNEQNAVNFQATLSEEHQIESNIEQLSLEAYSVYSGPFTTRDQAQKLMDNYRKIDVLSAAFMKYDPASVSDYRYNYQIMAGSFDSKTRAYQIAESIQENYGNTTEVITKQDGESYVIVSNFTSYQQVSATIDRLKNSSLNLSPILYLSEES